MRHGKTTPTREAVQRNFKNLPALTSECFAIRHRLWLSLPYNKLLTITFYTNCRIYFYTQPGEWLADRTNGGGGKIDSRTWPRGGDLWRACPRKSKSVSFRQSRLNLSSFNVKNTHHNKTFVFQVCYAFRWQNEALPFGRLSLAAKYWISMPYISPDGAIYHIALQHFAKLDHNEVWDA